MSYVPKTNEALTQYGRDSLIAARIYLGFIVEQAYQDLGLEVPVDEHGNGPFAQAAGYSRIIHTCENCQYQNKDNDSRYFVITEVQTLCTTCAYDLP